MESIINIVVLDDEVIAMEGLVNTLEHVRPDFNVKGFTDPELAIEYAWTVECQIAFLDIEMYEINGIEVAKAMCKKSPWINIIFTTAHSEFTLDALNLHASGYILKPVTKRKIENELNHLRFKLERGVEIKNTIIKIRAFGDFQVFINEAPAKFKYTKTKELLAYLVDRKGALCTKGDICGVLFGDESKTKNSYYNNLHADLINTMKDNDAEDVIAVRRGKLGIRVDLVDCDYFKWLKNPSDIEHSYMGEYMSQYSWAETTNAYIEKSIVSFKLD